MKKIKKHIKQNFGKQIWYISLLFLLAFLVSSFSNTPQNLFTEKTTETEKEENKNEKEQLDEEDGEVCSFTKYKKIKKSPKKFAEQETGGIVLTPKFSVYFLPQLLTLSSGAEFCLSAPLVPACPRFIAFHQLIFYEI
ncbi:MAG: hypothetical protein OHK0045_20180 [Raineya sp.]